MSCKRKRDRSNKVLPLILQADDVTKYYSSRSEDHWFKQNIVHAVDGVTLNLYEGETLGLVGESGSGKSTLGRVLIGLEEPSSGTVNYKMQDLHDLGKKSSRQARLDLQMIFQDPYSALNPKKRIYDILSTPLLYHNLATKQNVDAEVDRLLNLVGLPSSASRRYPHEFSGGQLQRIGIAAALSLKPKLIVCDEPVSALDVSIQAQILNLLCQLQEEMGFAYLFIAHGLAAVKYISDRIAVMYLGRIVEIAPAEKLFSQPLHPYTQALISAAPIPHPDLDHDETSLLKGEVPSNINPPSGCPFHPRCPLAEESCRKIRPELENNGDVEEDGGCRTHRKAQCVACPIMLRRYKEAKATGKTLEPAFPGALRTADYNFKSSMEHSASNNLSHRSKPSPDKLVQSSQKQTLDRKVEGGGHES